LRTKNSSCGRCGTNSHFSVTKSTQPRFSNRSQFCFSNPGLPLCHLKILKRSHTTLVSLLWFDSLAIDDDIVWKSGISVQDAPNHYIKTYDSSRVSLLHLLVSLLSQPLFHSPEEYLVVLNPFATYMTSRRCKNIKNLFVSLLNVVISYDSTGYVSRIMLNHLGYSIYECNWYTRRKRNFHHTLFAPNTYFDWV
jgi:hypothetical protein